ncbi:SDR family oxidoreductase [Haloprofundus salilacus]|uniref:SDR family oxidoreductase n=1 Tax=Haloprofundus salilacus TaxID=2876190 RepID=UPI001CCBC38D|nr:SDR family oxidoreductase [Haloprofundus salilacus]
MLVTRDVPILGSVSEPEFTKQIPAGRSDQPEDVTDVALYLASDLSNSVTAESIVVDGGLSNTQ